MQLDHIRKQITAIDDDIVKKLEQRFKLCVDIGEIKQQNHLPILDEKREQQVLDNIEKSALNYPTEIKAIFREIMKQAKNIE